MRDDHDRLALVAHAAQDGKKLFDFLWSQDRCWLIQDQDFRVTIQGLQQFDSLLLTDRKTLNRGIGIDGEFELIREFANFVGSFLQIKRRGASRFRAEHDIFGHGHWLDEHKVLMDHADAERDCVMRRAYLVHLAIDQNVAAVSDIETISDAHRRRFARAILTDDCVNRTRRHFEADAIVCQHGAEAF